MSCKSQPRPALSEKPDMKNANADDDIANKNIVIEGSSLR
jgi:hypothetical protein